MVLKTKKKVPERPLQRRSPKAIALCVAATTALLALDLGTKFWAEDALSEPRVGGPPPVCEPDEHGYTTQQRRQKAPMVLIEGYLELRYAENCGAAFSMLRSAPALVRTGLFGLAAVAASIALMWMFVMGRGQQWFAFAVPLIVSGALGNLADRLRLGYVIDFVRFHWSTPIFGYTEWPTWNVADATILIGVVMLLIDGYYEGKLEKELAAKQTKDAPAEA